MVLRFALRLSFYCTDCPVCISRVSYLCQARSYARIGGFVASRSKSQVFSPLLSDTLDCISSRLVKQARKQFASRSVVLSPAPTGSAEADGKPIRRAIGLDALQPNRAEEQYQKRGAGDTAERYPVGIHLPFTALSCKEIYTEPQVCT